MKVLKNIIVFIAALIMISCNNEDKTLVVDIYETSAGGNKLNKNN